MRCVFCETGAGNPDSIRSLRSSSTSPLVPDLVIARRAGDAGDEVHDRHDRLNRRLRNRSTRSYDGLPKRTIRHSYHRVPMTHLGEKYPPHVSTRKSARTASNGPFSRSTADFRTTGRRYPRPEVDEVVGPGLVPLGSALARRVLGEADRSGDADRSRR